MSFGPGQSGLGWACCFLALSPVGSCGSGPHSQRGEGWRAEKGHTQGKWKSSVLTQIVVTDYSTHKTAFIVNCLLSQALPLASFLHLVRFKCLAGPQGGRALSLLLKPFPTCCPGCSQGGSVTPKEFTATGFRMLLCSFRCQSCTATPLDVPEFCSVHFIHTTSRAGNRPSSWAAHEDLWVSVTLALADVSPWVTEVLFAEPRADSAAVQSSFLLRKCNTQPGVGKQLRALSPVQSRSSPSSFPSCRFTETAHEGLWCQGAQSTHCCGIPSPFSWQAAKELAPILLCPAWGSAPVLEHSGRRRDKETPFLLFFYKTMLHTMFKPKRSCNW